MTVRHPTFRLLMGLLALAVLTGCSGGGGGSGRQARSAPTTVPPPRTTPRIRGGDPELEPLLLTLHDVASIRELPPGLQAVPPAAVGLFEDPDPRGPCGARIPRPSLSGGALAVFATDDLIILDVVVRPGQPAVDRFLHDELADERTPCRPFDTTTNSGQTQDVQPLVVEVPGRPHDAVASLEEIDVGNNVVFAGMAARGRGDLLDVVAVQSSSPVPTDALLELVARMSDALARPLGAV